MKISESVVNSVVSKSKSSAGSGSSSGGGGAGAGGHSPRLNDAGSSKQRHDSKEEHQPGICTIIDIKKLIKHHANTSSNSTGIIIIYEIINLGFNLDLT